MSLSIVSYETIEKISRAAEDGDEKLGSLLESKEKGWIDSQDEKGRTALHYTVLWNSGETQRTITTLINKGADPNKQNEDGETPLHLALYNHCVLAQGKGAEEQVIALLKGRANPMIKDGKGETVLEQSIHEHTSVQVSTQLQAAVLLQKAKKGNSVGERLLGKSGSGCICS